MGLQKMGKGYAVRKKRVVLRVKPPLVTINFLVQSSGFDLNHNKKAFKKNTVKKEAGPINISAYPVIKTTA